MEAAGSAVAAISETASTDSAGGLAPGPAVLHPAIWAARLVNAGAAPLADPAELLEDRLAVGDPAGDAVERLGGEEEHRAGHRFGWLAARVVDAIEHLALDRDRAGDRLGGRDAGDGDAMGVALLRE